MDVSLVTTNGGKVAEIRALLPGVHVHWVDRALVEPQADSLEEVAREKLRQVPRTRGFVLLEDSGLFIESLHGFPGVYSSHIYRIWKFEPILRLLRGRSRAATFRTVAGIRHGRQIRFFTGECRGEITPRPRGTGGFGFDPIFRPSGSRRTFGEMSVSEKSRFSHRARAMRKVAQYLAQRAPS